MIVTTGFKQFADRCLNGKLSGHFILRSGGTLHSNRLQKLGFYRFTQWQYAYNEIGECINGPHCWDIIKFESNMNKENDKRIIQISLQQAREWYNSGNNTLKTLALSSFSKKEIDPYSRNWNEYLENHPGLLLSLIAPEPMCSELMTYSKLLLLRKEWIHIWSQEQRLDNDWEPDWSTAENKKFYIGIDNDRRSIRECRLFVEYSYTIVKPFSFPTKELALDFRNTFKSLLEETIGLY